MVTFTLLSRMSWTASRWWRAGWPSSAPARSKPTTPLPLYATASSARRTEVIGSMWRMPQMITFDLMPVSRFAWRSPCSTASTMVVGFSPFCVCSTGE